MLISLIVIVVYGKTEVTNRVYVNVDTHNSEDVKTEFERYSLSCVEKVRAF